MDNTGSVLLQMRDDDEDNIQENTSKTLRIPIGISELLDILSRNSRTNLDHPDFARVKEIIGTSTSFKMYLNGNIRKKYSSSRLS